MTGVWSMLRLALRRDRWLLPLWVVGLAIIPAFSAAATKDLYPSVASRVEAAEAINGTAAFVALYGRVYDPTSLGALSLIKMTAFGSALVGVVFVFLIVRHTRSEEATGRAELVAAGRVGRLAPLAAALLLGVFGSVALGALTATGLIAVGLPLPGSVAFGLGWTLTGMVFSSIAAIAAQLTMSARAALGMSVAAVATAYLIRAVGDLVDGDPAWLSWLSPIGWSQQLRPFAGDRWWVAPIALGTFLALVGVAISLRARRDLGAGIFPERLGRAHGRMQHAFQLTWRLQRGTFAAWLIASVVMGFILGTVAHNVTGLLSSEAMREYIAALGGEQGLIDAFLAAALAILASIFGAFAVAAMLRLASEEDSGHAELLLSTRTARVHWVFGVWTYTVVATVVLLALTGAAFGLGHGIEVGNVTEQTSRLALAGIAQAPAVWVLAGITLAVWGWLPRLAQLTWAVLVVFIMLSELGPLLELPQWILDLSPFAHTPKLPGGEVAVGQLIGLIVVAIVLALVGLLGWRRRDVA